MKTLGTGFILAAVALLAGCYTVPETGRKSLVFLPPAQEAMLGIEQFRQIKRTEKISHDPELNERVQRVGGRVARAVGDALPEAQWEFVVFESRDVNAFALPGGKVGVYTGLLKLAESDDELGIVIGHEIGHVTARHGGERMSQGILLAAGGIVLSEALEDNSKRNAWLAAYGAGAALGVVLPYSRLNETEADEIGLVYAARAGYDPRAAITFWERMTKTHENKPRPPAFLSTHPSDAARIRHLQELMPKALPIYERAGKDY